MKKQIIIFLFILSTFNINAAKIYTSDIVNFWIAFDSIQTTKSYSQKLKFINDLYINKGTNGLHDFIKNVNYTKEEWVKTIDAYPKYWKSIRPQTMLVLGKINEIENISEKFREIYPEFFEPEIYFTIGCLRSGGTTTKGRILIGTEIGAADHMTNASELNKWLRNCFQINSGIIQLLAHEMNHTQQIESTDSIQNPTLLSQSILEGSCDFIAELILNRKYVANHISYGLTHTKELLKEFYKNKDQLSYEKWLYNGNNSKRKPADLGYFIGYKICKDYYENSIDKSKAIFEIINLNWSDNNNLLIMLNYTMKKNGL